MNAYLRRLARPTARWARRILRRLLAGDAGGPPPDAAKDIAIVWGLKLHGSQLARKLYAERVQPLIDASAGEPASVPLTSKLCEEADIESAWFVYWCAQLKLAPIYHRKVWEECFALQAILEAGLMRPGVSGLCFGAGEEPLPSYLASRGVAVLATDLAPDSAAAADWIATGQHASTDRLYFADLVDRPSFDRHVAFRAVDMNAIPSDLEGKFDLVWSLCALEHVGSAELACRFIERSLACLKPGGLAIHTTEYNLTSETDTVTAGWCVLFTRPQIEALTARLNGLGYEVLTVSFNPGSAPLDQYIDLPPFPQASLTWVSPNVIALPEAPHLRLALMGHVTTSIALLIRRIA